MTENTKPNHHTIGIEVNRAIIAGIHNKKNDRENAIKRVTELLAHGGTQAITVFSKIQNGK